jgi:hypothetical protein
MVVGEAFPTGPAFLLAESSFPSLKTPTVLSQQELRNPVGKAFANSLALLAKRVFPVVQDFLSDAPKKEMTSMPSEDRRRFSPERQRSSRKHLNKTPPRRSTTPEDAAVVDTDTIAGKAFARRFVQCRPDDKGEDEPQH